MDLFAHRPPETDRPDAGDASLGAGRRRTQVWDVAAFLHAINDALTARFAGVAVRGEISGFQRARSGHCYFVLKDGDGQAALRCVMFRRAAALVDFSPQDGDLVEIRGRLTVYEPRGDLQFAVESMQRSGAGTLFERFMRLKAQFEAEGLFDPARKRPIAAHPRAIGVVSSADGAALHDVLVALHRRAPHVRIVVYPTPVQGAGAAAAIAAAIATANRRNEVTTLLLCRGGGSLEDLWAFNEAAVVAAVAGSALPVVCGVGHETDVSLADFAADLRAPTPTAAAELAARPRRDALNALQTLAERLGSTVHHVLDRHAQRHDRLQTRLARPAQALAALRHRVDAMARARQEVLERRLERERNAAERLAGRLRRAAPLAVTQARHAERLLAGRLQAVDPKQVLLRGYAWLSDARGHALVSAAQIAPGQQIEATLADGRVAAVVEQVEQASAR